MNFFWNSIFLALINCISSQNIHNNLNVDYILVNEGATKNNIDNNRAYYKFSTAFNQDYIISNFTNNYELCEISCSLDSNCLGIFKYYDYYNEYCNTLSELR